MLYVRVTFHCGFHLLLVTIAVLIKYDCYCTVLRPVIYYVTTYTTYRPTCHSVEC